MDSIIEWIKIIPLEGPVKALVIVGLMLGLAAVLFAFWEVVLRVSSLLRPTKRYKEGPSE
jgi:hypothetical protein